MKTVEINKLVRLDFQGRKHIKLYEAIYNSVEVILRLSAYQLHSQ